MAQRLGTRHGPGREADAAASRARVKHARILLNMIRPCHSRHVRAVRAWVGKSARDLNTSINYPHTRKCYCSCLFVILRLLPVQEQKLGRIHNNSSIRVGG